MFDDPVGVVSNKPILLVQDATGQELDGLGYEGEPEEAPADPFMMTVPPADRDLSSYDLAAPAAQFDGPRVGDSLNPVVPQVDVGGVTRDQFRRPCGGSS